MKRGEKIKGRCSYPECKAKARIQHDCLTCNSETFRACKCEEHRIWAAEKIRRHALTAHPVNILRAMVAALRGEDVF